MLISDRRTTWLSGILVFLLGAVLLVGGIDLWLAGGSAYYTLVGAALVGSGVLYVRGNRLGEVLYALVLLCTMGWAVAEAGTNPWAFMARVFALVLLGFWLSSAWVRSGLGVSSPQSWRSETRLASVLALLVMVGLFVGFELSPIEAGTPDRTAAAVVTAPDPADTDWVHYGNGLDGQRRAPFSQINPGNVEKLEVAWTYRSGELEDRAQPSASTPHSATTTPGARNEATPIKVGNRLYTCSTYANVYAVDARTGRELWRSSTGAEGRRNGFACRGVSYYRQANAAGPCAERIFIGVPSGQLRAMDALTGALCQDFGNHGNVSLLDHMGHALPNLYITDSPPTVVGDLVVVGSAVYDNQDADMPSGVIKAYDARTGALRWAWDMGAPDRIGAPPPGQTYTRSTPNSWTVFAADEKLGLVYVPLGNASPDYWGLRRRPFDEKYGSSLVALNLTDGRPRWSFQTTHHDLWDFDLSAPPILLDLPGPKGARPAIVQTTKRGDIFVLDRRTGIPIVPVREVPAPSRGAMPGEHLSPTQPVSSLSLIPPPITEQQMWGLTPIDQMICRIRYRHARNGLFAPPGLDWMLQQPGQVGTIDWGGATVDTERKLLVTNASYLPWIVRQVPRDKVRDPDHTVWPQRHTPYIAEAEPFLSSLQIPCNQPPWGSLIVLNLTTGKPLWKRVVGTARDNGPLGIPIGLPLLVGQPSFGGALVTRSGLIFMGATLDRYFRAFDLNTGHLLWQMRLPAGGQATPMTYMAGGRQYVVLTVGGHAGGRTKAGDFTIAYALPRPPS